MYKICRCCQRSWPDIFSFLATTRFIGVQRFDEKDLGDLWLFNCTCGSTQAMRMEDKVMHHFMDSLNSQDFFENELKVLRNNDRNSLYAEEARK